MGSATHKAGGFRLGKKPLSLIVHPDPWGLWFGQKPAEFDREGECAAERGQVPVDGSRLLALADSLIRVLLHDSGSDLVKPCSGSDGVPQDAERRPLPLGLSFAVFVFEVSQGMRSLGPAVNVVAFSDLGSDFFENTLGSSTGAYLPADVSAIRISPSSEPGIPNRDPVSRPASASLVRTLNLSGNLNPNLSATRADDLTTAEKSQGSLLVSKRIGNS